MKARRAARRFPLTLLLLLAFPAAAGAQQMAPGGPAPGQGDAAKASNSYRQSVSDYNHLVGSADSKVVKKQATPKRQGNAVPATVADIKPGNPLRDSKGVAIGTIDSVDAQGVVVNTGTTKIRVPLTAFGKDEQGLLLGITAARFDELVAKAQASR